MTIRGSARPRRELRARPLEAVIGMAELPCGQGLPHCVVLGVRRRHDNCRWLRGAENVLLGRRQTRRVEMLNDFDERRRVEPD